MAGRCLWVPCAGERKQWRRQTGPGLALKRDKKSFMQPCTNSPWDLRTAPQNGACLSSLCKVCMVWPFLRCPRGHLSPSPSPSLKLQLSPRRVCGKAWQIISNYAVVIFDDQKAIVASVSLCGIWGILPLLRLIHWWEETLFMSVLHFLE